MYQKQSLETKDLRTILSFVFRSIQNNPTFLRVMLVMEAKMPETLLEQGTPEDLKTALLELDQIERVQRDRKKTSGIDYYIPNKAQLRCHQSLAKIILYCGGNRAGKSTMGAATLTFHLTRKYPDWFPTSQRFYGPIKAVVVCDANAKIEKVIEPKNFEYLPKKYILKRKVVFLRVLLPIFCFDDLLNLS